MQTPDTDMKEVRCALETYSEWHCPAVKFSGRQWQSSNINIHLIWTGRLPALHRQSFSPRSPLEDHIPLNSSIFLSPHFFLKILFIYFFSSHRQLHSTQRIINNGTQKKWEGARFKRRVKNGRKPRDTQSCLRVVVMLPFPPSFSSIVCDCNRTSGGKIKSLFCYQNTGTWPWVRKASEQNRIAIE